MSKIVCGDAKTVLLGGNMYVMTQAPDRGEEPCLPHGLSMVNTYTEVAVGSRCIAIVIKNQTAAPIIIVKGIKVTWVVAVNRVPPVEVMPGTLEMLDKMHGVQQLDLSGLEEWSRENYASMHALLTKYHEIFSLEPGELSCTDLAKHEIRVVDDEPFKERFQRIPPPMVEEVTAHVKEKDTSN